MNFLNGFPKSLLTDMLAGRGSDTVGQAGGSRVLALDFSSEEMLGRMGGDWLFVMGPLGCLTAP